MLEQRGPRGRLQRRHGVDGAGQTHRTHSPAGSLCEHLFRRAEAQPAVHGGKPVPLRRVREHAGSRAGLMSIDPPINRLKRALRGGDVQIGLWSCLASAVEAEVVAGSGFDWILLDTEHAPNELPMVVSQLQALAGGTAP